MTYARNTVHQLGGSASTTIGIIHRVIVLTASPTSTLIAIPSHMRTVVSSGAHSVHRLGAGHSAFWRADTALSRTLLSSMLTPSRQHHPTVGHLAWFRRAMRRMHIAHCGEPFGGSNYEDGCRSRIVEIPSDHGKQHVELTLPSAAFPVHYDCD